MKLQKFKERNNKQKSIIIFTIACVLLITGVFLYKTFASFQVVENEDLIHGDVSDPGDIYFAFYKENKIQKEMPKKSEGYVLDESKSYCGVTGGNDSDIKVHVTENDMIFVEGVTTSRTKCNLYFAKGAYILGKGIPTVTEGNGLYEVKHDGVSGTIKDEGFNQTEYRYAGSDPNNYIKFNEEEWRIIGLVNVMTSEETVEQRVKIVRKDSIGDLAWDTARKNDWIKASLKTLLNEGDYYKRLNAYSTTGLLEISKMMIDNTIIWNLGSVEQMQYGAFSYDEWYIKERGNAVYQGNSFLWKEGNKVGLIYPSDYMYAIDGKMKDACKTSSQYTVNLCYEQNWIYKENSYSTWTIATYQNLDYSSLIIRSNDLPEEKGKISGGNATTQSRSVNPTLYLKPNVKIFNEGDGSKDNPFQLVQILK